MNRDCLASFRYDPASDPLINVELEIGGAAIDDVEQVAGRRAER
jgi:hypothetical protein